MDAIGLCFFDCFYQCTLALKSNGDALYSDRERKILIETYGLASSEIHTYKEIASELELSQERIRQIHLKIFKKLVSLQKKNYPAIVKINNFISQQQTIDIKCNNQFALYIKQFHENHMPDFSLSLLLRLLSFYIYRHSGYADKWESCIYRDRSRVRKEQSHKQRLNSRLSDFLEKILWFDNIKIWSEKEIKVFTPSRQYDIEDTDKRSKPGEFFSKKLNRNVFYESILEKHFYDFLEECPEVVNYIEQCEKVPYLSKNKIHYYTPDVTVLLDDGRCFIVEIKDFSGMVERKVHNKFKALIKYCQIKGMGAILTDGRNDFSIILSHQPNVAFERALKERLENNPSNVFYPELKMIRTKYNATNMEICRAIVFLNLSFYRSPFMIQKSNNSIFCEELINLANIQQIAENQK